MFVLVDCNSFYASCEAIFRPELRGEGVIVLSNSDGCVVARSKEAKSLGVPDMVPFFKIAHLVKQHSIHVLSSNYPLYGDISNRVMDTLRTFSPEVEVYSIDEMFLRPANIQEDLKEYGQRIKKTVWKHVRIPVGVGFGKTKTLSKLANKAAKKITALNGVCVLEREDQREWLLRKVQVQDIWGIGSRFGARLNGLGIISGWDLANADAKRLRKHFNVNLERTINELNGISCLDLDELPSPKKQIYCTRCFGEKTTAIEPILEATSLYATRAAEKLRKQQHFVKTIHVFLQTSAYDQNSFSNSGTIQLPYPTDDTRVIVAHARKAVSKLFVPGYRYQKSGVGLVDIVDKAFLQEDIFTRGQSAKSDELMRVMDKVNSKYGRGTIHTAAEGVNKEWAMKQNFRSKSYTTSWTELPLCVC